MARMSRPLPQTHQDQWNEIVATLAFEGRPDTVATNRQGPADRLALKGMNDVSVHNDGERACSPLFFALFLPLARCYARRTDA